MRERLKALDDSFGAAAEDDFDGLSGADYVTRQRCGLAERPQETVGE